MGRAMGLSIWKACGPVALPLLLLSIAVFTVLFERLAFWWRWWQRQQRTRRRVLEALQATPADQRDQRLAEQARQMASGEPVLQAALVLAPLLGLLGTVSGLMAVLRDLGPQLLLPANAPLAGYADVLMSTLVGLQLTVIAAALLLLNQGLRRWQLDWLRRQLPPAQLEP